MAMNDIFTEIFDHNIQALICRYTDKKANETFAAWNAAHPDKAPQKWTSLTEEELLAYCGVLLVMGSFRSNCERIVDLWNTN